MRKAVTTKKPLDIVHPVRDQIYTLEEILNSLKLPDSPSLLIDEQNNCIQSSHVTEEELLGVPGISDTRWRYERTTHEWIPLFRYVDDMCITHFCEIQATHDGNGKWVTPKGYPRVEPELL